MSNEYRVESIHLSKIYRDEDFNCRISVTMASVEELAEQIEQLGRLVVPVIVQPAEEAEIDIPPRYTHRLICGFRRTLACQMLGWEKVPAQIECGLTERQVQMLNLKENLDRKNLNIMEEAIALDNLFPAYRTITSIAEELKKSRDWVATRRTLMDLSTDIQEAAARGKLTERDIKTIMRHHDPDEKMKQILRAVAKGRGHKSKVLYEGHKVRTKAEVKELMRDLLEEGMNPNIVRLLGWTIGEVDQPGLEKSLQWLRLRRGWLK